MYHTEKKALCYEEMYGLEIMICIHKFANQKTTGITVYNCLTKTKQLSFFSLPDVSKIWKLSEYSYFHGNIVICISSVRICSPYNMIQLEILVMGLPWWSSG